MDSGWPHVADTGEARANTLRRPEIYATGAETVVNGCDRASGWQDGEVGLGP